MKKETKSSLLKMKRWVTVLFLGGTAFFVVIGLMFYFYTNYHIVSKNTWVSMQQKIDEQEKTIKEQAAKLETTAKGNEPVSTQGTQNKTSVSDATVEKTIETKQQQQPVLSQEEKKTESKPNTNYSLQDAYREMGLNPTGNHSGQVKELGIELMNFRKQHPGSSYTVKDALKELHVQSANPSLANLKQAIQLVESKS